MLAELYSLGNRVKAVAWPPGMRTVAIFAAAMLILFARRPETLMRAEFRHEDGQVFYLGTFFGSLGSVFEGYQGYVHVVPRLVALASRLFPVEWAPLVTNFLAFAITAGVATFVASKRLSRAIPDDRLRLLIAMLLLLLPGSDELFGSITYAPWWLAVFLVARLVATPPRSTWMVVLDGVALLLAGLSSPAVLLIFPLYLWHDRAAARWLVVPLVVQAAALAIGNRIAPIGDYDPLTFGQILITRAVLEPLLGARLTGSISNLPDVLEFMLAIGVLGLLTATFRTLPRAALLAGTYIVFATVSAGLLASPERGAVLLNTDADQRYFFLAAALMATGIMVSVWTMRRRSALLLAALLTVGVVVDFRMPMLPDLNWPHASTCIGGPSPCEVPVQQPEVWTIRWPGADGPYDPRPIGR